jgi:hypothetical protein
VIETVTPDVNDGCEGDPYETVGGGDAGDAILC